METTNQYELVPVKRRFDAPAPDSSFSPSLELRRLHPEAVMPRPTFDSHDYGSTHPHRSYLMCPLYRYVVAPGQTVLVETGWALHGYPAATHTVLLRLSVTAVRSMLATTLVTLDSMLGQAGSLDNIIVPVTNNHSRDNAFLGPEDRIFEISMVPKLQFRIVPHVDVLHRVEIEKK